MADPVPQIPISQPQKRPLEDDAPAPVTTPTKAPTATHSAASSPLSVLSTVPSPSPTKLVFGQSQSSYNAAVGGASVPNSSSSIVNTAQQPATKKRKLTNKEKEDRRAEREAKEKERADIKAKREEEKRLKEDEKRIKDEEKRKKNEEKEEKKRAKELDQLQKEEERRKKEEEKQKKEKSQLRLNAFFSKPKLSKEVSGTASGDSTQTPSTKPIFLKPDPSLPVANPQAHSRQKATQKKVLTDYERYFLPFQLPSGAILARYNRFMDSHAVLVAARARLDRIAEQEETDKTITQPETLKTMISTRGPRGTKSLSVVEIVERINGSSDHPVDLTNDSTKSEDPVELLKQIPMKYLLFPEDVRPPYYGTYTKPHSEREAAKVARNPFSRVLHETDYDYDSEAEWEEPEEGEDLDSEGEDDLEDEDEDDLDGFLDDDDDPQLKRRLISGDLEPVSTGLCWEDPQGVSRLNDGSGAISTEFKDFRIGFLLEPQPRSIDPFSTAYWAPEPSSTTLSFATLNNQTSGLMNPPRLPLTQRPVNGMLNTLNAPIVTAAGASTSKPAKPPKRMIPPEFLPEFRDTVDGSDLTKLALVEALKKKFPKLPKDAINNTLTAIASRVGAKEAEKRWVLLS
ncbi:hypothetical protein GQ43DRAFT_457762 [Delitschia confertaspora ATCC 74209]|uniref:Chromatin assembly factor 1 subunit A n=1 Tax=Delitschia confertaspora ATCC 74209 TaxID=1513339 RepID=A0A9P4JG00_9PLEO|nr:hypothetical protein GQ43DRAFT_457762 [Delitschia confertaspora ATCC 74209]